MTSSAEARTAKRFEAALKLIAAFRGMTLLGGRDLSSDEAHELGASKAFNQCADIARDVLSNTTGASQ